MLENKRPASTAKQPTAGNEYRSIMRESGSIYIEGNQQAASEISQPRWILFVPQPFKKMRFDENALLLAAFVC
jgi:hypothetical protein